MLKETARIVAINDDALWVETIQKSTCGSCVAQKGCGQTLLNRLGAKPVYVRVLPGDRSPGHYHINQTIEIGIPEDLVVRGSLLAYFVPVILALVFAGVAHNYWALEWLSILGFIFGFSAGCGLLRWHAAQSKNDSRYQAVIVDGAEQLTAVSQPPDGNE